LKPRVFSCIPTRGTGHCAALQSHYALPTRGGTEIIPGMAVSSLLCHGFNLLWAAALNWHRAGVVDYFCLHHDEIRTHAWLDVMIEELKRVGAAVLSVVQPIKDDSGNTSTAIEPRDPWRPQKLTLAELATGPETFCASDFPGYKGPLLVNTGLMLVDLARPEFHAVNDAGELSLCFHIADRVILGKDGNYVAQVRSEDWEFSRMCHARGLPVYATRKVECLHHGDRGFTNQPPAPRPALHYYQDIEGWMDFEDVYREAVGRVPDGGTIVEVGCWKGKSLSFLLVEARDSGKRLKIIGVDHFEGSVGQPGMVEAAQAVDLGAECERNCRRAGYPFEIIRQPSCAAAARFKSGSLDFVFVDGSHDFESVQADIRAWMPKVKPDGVLAGHDYDEQGVALAVRQTLPRESVRRKGRCWWYEVGDQPLSIPGARGRVGTA
jgi:hypothetical protein